MKEDKIRGFSIGIDDYVTKPFDEDELLFRIKSILKRTNPFPESGEKEIFELGRYTFDVLNQELKSERESKRLTSKESKILAILARYKNNIVSREEIMQEVWGKLITLSAEAWMFLYRKSGDTCKLIQASKLKLYLPLALF